MPTINERMRAAGISKLGITIQADSAYCGMVPANAAMVATGTYNIAFGYQNTARSAVF